VEQNHPTTTASTLAELAEKWAAIGLKRKLASSTRVSYAAAARHLLRWGAALDPARLDLHDYIAFREMDRVSPRTILLELRVARILLRWARKTGQFPVGHVLEIPALKFDRRAFVVNHRTPKPDEVARMLAAMPDDEWRLAALLLARTGARIGEICHLRSCDLDRRIGELRLGAVSDASKSGVRTFPLDADSLRRLAGRDRRGEAPLVDFGVKAADKGLARRIARACEAADVARFTPHGLRRMVVRRLLKAGVDPGTAASLTGHSVQVMLRYYQEIDDEDRREAAEQAGLGDIEPGVEPEVRRLAVRYRLQLTGREGPEVGAQAAAPRRAG
jgi:integrase